MTGKRSVIRVGHVIGVILLFASCATLSNVKPWAQRTPEEKSLSFYQVYNRQFAATMKLANSPTLTEGQREVVRTKKKVLTEIRPLIDLYDALITEGRVPAEDLESQIIGLVDKLLAMGG